MKNIHWLFLFIFCFLFLSINALSQNNFVKVENNQLTLYEKPVYFSGINQYYLFYKSHKMIDSVIDDAKALNMNVIRTWAFCEGAMHEGFCYQPSPRSYHEQTFQNLDYVIYKAKKDGIRLILTLSNNWSDFGGVDQYLKWVNDNSNHDNFFKNEQIKSIYKDYIKYVLTRTNTYTGIAYKDDPTILMWELMNEPRCNDANALYIWVDEIAGFIKNIDTNHLISTGSEGSISSDFVETHKSKNIDIASFHLYPDSWGFSDQQSIDYIIKHATLASETLKKPVFLSEFGLRDKQKRIDIYEKWYTTANENKVDGMLLWILSSKQDDGSLYPDYDGFTIWCPESGNICDILKNISTKRDYNATLFYP